MIKVLKYLFLGLVQGICEILPVSSSAHLIIIEKAFNISDDNFLLEIILHLGSLIAILIFEREAINRLIKGFFSYLFKKEKNNKREYQYVWCLVISSIPLVLFTLIFENIINKVSMSLMIIGIFLMINGIMLFISQKFITINNSQINYKKALIIGFSQMFGVFPGISRSGSCLVGGYICKMDKEETAKFAFLMFIPVMIGALINELLKINNFVFTNDLILYLISFLVVIPVTYYSLKYLLQVIKRGKIVVFGIYTIILGLILVLLF